MLRCCCWVAGCILSIAFSQSKKMVCVIARWLPHCGWADAPLLLLSVRTGSVRSSWNNSSIEPVDFAICVPCASSECLPVASSQLRCACYNLQILVDYSVVRHWILTISEFFWFRFLSKFWVVQLVSHAPLLTFTEPA